LELPQLSKAEARAEILERNMSCLFTSARLEIHRKNQEISHLRAMFVAAARLRPMPA
jgi:hypothetical protein